MKFHKILFKTDAETVSFLILKKRESFSPKKYSFGRCQYQNNKALFTDSILRVGFGLANLLNSLPSQLSGH